MSVVLETTQLLNGIKFKNGQLSLKEMFRIRGAIGNDGYSVLYDISDV